MLKGLTLEGNKTPKSWIRETVRSGFNMTCKSVIERRVTGNGNDEVIPTMELSQRQLIFEIVSLWTENSRDRVTPV